MPTVLQLRRGTTAQNDAFTGSAGELTFNTTTGALRAHDGTTAGGAEMLVNDGSNADISQSVTLTGAVTGSATITNLGNLSIATTATSDPTITLAGDLTGSVTLTNLGNGTLTATVVDDSHNQVLSNIDGITATVDELNILDGVTATAAELNTLDGITATVTELNYTDGVTSNIQTQLDSKAPTASPTFTGVPAAPTATAGTNTTQIATTAFVETAITNLIGGAPGALDTLNELAAAINDDASYASTITTALGTKAATSTTISAGTGLTGGGDLSANRSFALATSGVSANTYGSSTAIPVITVDAYGRITSATTSSVTVGNGTITCATSGTGLSGSASFTLNQSGNTTFTVTSNATSANTASTIVARDASGNFTAGVITATTTSARYADLAEKYSADAEYAPGTVVMFGGEAEVTAANEFATRKVAGVVSTEPAHIMNDALVAKHVITLALAGRVPCRVNGVVRKGDLMVSSNTPGCAVAWGEELRDPPAGSIIGKALENKSGQEEGIIEVVVGVR